MPHAHLSDGTDPPLRPPLQSNWGYNLGSNDWKGPTGYISGKSIDPLMGRRWEEIQVRACCCCCCRRCCCSCSLGSRPGSLGRVPIQQQRPSRP